MSAEQNIFLGLSTKEIQVVMCISLTVNFCILWNILAPILCKILARCLGRQGEEGFSKRFLKTPGSLNRLCTSLLFYTVLPICGVVLLCTTDVLQNPFFAFDRRLAILFSINTGFFVFRVAQVTYYHTEIPHYQALLIHHTVAIATYLIIIHFEQNAISGVIGLLMEGNLVFAEFERLFKILKVPSSSKTWKLNMVLRAVSAVIGKACVPTGLLIYVFMTSSSDMFKMNYISLAFFFLSLVFFSCVNCWFIKDILLKCWRYFRSLGRSPPATVYSLANNGVISTVINHDGLLKLSQQYHGAEVNITCNDLWEAEEAKYFENSKSDEKVVIEEMSPSIIKTTNLL